MKGTVAVLTNHAALMKLADSDLRNAGHGNQKLPTEAMTDLIRVQNLPSGAMTWPEEIKGWQQDSM